MSISAIFPQVEFTYVYPCPSITFPLLDPPRAINENGRETFDSSHRHFDNPFLASDVFPIPGEPSNPKQ